METRNIQTVKLSAVNVALLDHNYNLYKPSNYKEPQPPPPKKNKTCILCFKQFKNRRTWKEHILTVHNKVKIQCRDCPSILSSHRSLQIHYKRYHPLKSVPPKTDTKQIEVIEQLAELDDVEAEYNNSPAINLSSQRYFILSDNKVNTLADEMNSSTDTLIDEG